MSALPVAYATSVPTRRLPPADQFDPAQCVAALIRDMRDPTAEQLQTMLSALNLRLRAMDARGCYEGLESVADHVLDAFGALDDVTCNPDGRHA